VLPFFYLHVNANVLQFISFSIIFFQISSSHYYADSSILSLPDFYNSIEIDRRLPIHYFKHAISIINFLKIILLQKK